MTGLHGGRIKPSATRAGSLVALVVAGALVGVIGIALEQDWLMLLGLAFAVTASGATLLLTERHQDEWMTEEVDRLETEHARLSDQLITAEQEERRRLALFLHDGPVQSMAGIGLMLDAAIGSIDSERLEDARRVLASALERHRETIRSLRELSFNVEPVVLRDQGFAPAVRAFADQVGLSNQVQIDLDLDAADNLAEKAQVGLYQIIREAVSQAIRRGPPSRISIRVEQVDGEIATEISDDGTGERRRRSFEAIEERARTLNGRMTVGAGANGGTAVRVVLPRYAAESEN